VSVAVFLIAIADVANIVNKRFGERATSTRDDDCRAATNWTSFCLGGAPDTRIHSVVTTSRRSFMSAGEVERARSKWM
jgi:hypothetical protein